MVIYELYRVIYKINGSNSKVRAAISAVFFLSLFLTLDFVFILDFFTINFKTWVLYALFVLFSLLIGLPFICKKNLLNVEEEDNANGHLIKKWISNSIIFLLILFAVFFSVYNHVNNT